MGRKIRYMMGFKKKYIPFAEVGGRVFKKSQHILKIK